MQTGLTELQEKQIAKIIGKMSRVLSLAFAGEKEIVIGLYTLLTAQTFICRYLKKDSITHEEFMQIKKSLIINISNFQKLLFAMDYKGEKHE